MKSIVLNGVKYVEEKEALKAISDASKKKGGKVYLGLSGSEIKIAILQRGWVFIGRFTKNGTDCKLTDAYNIRTWGTTKGLGELAENGKTDKTNLDKVNDVLFHELGIVALLDVNMEKWDNVL